jgi:hypothetical protein
MTIAAVRNLLRNAAAVIKSGIEIAAHPVLDIRDRFQVVRIAAPTISAKMVEHEARFNGSIGKFVRQAVCHTILFGKVKVAVTFAFESVEKPATFRCRNL